MPDNRRAMVLASFLGDSLALGPHWQYDQGALELAFGRVENLVAPPPDGYHRGKQAGQFTHYGDQTLVLLESIARTGGFDIKDFSRRWLGLFQDYQGYYDGATKSTLANFSAGAEPLECGSSSNDLAGAARIAPLAFFLAGNELVEAARAQTTMTHNHGQVIEAAEFYARTLNAVLSGADPMAAMEEATKADYADLPAAEWLAKGLAANGSDIPAAVKSLGQTCHAHHAFPAVVRIVAAKSDDLEGALIENAMAGGDSAARGLVIGMILGAYLGWEAIPPRWLEQLQARERIKELLK